MPVSPAFIPANLSAAPARPNILFIAVDDLRPEVLSFGREGMITPNLDRLAGESLLFERAYCMVPTCGASRASLMTGIRPAPDRFTSFKTYASEDAPGITTLNTQLKNNGYYTVSLGKIFHHRDDNEQGWSEQPWRPSGKAYMNPMNNDPAEGYKNGLPYEREDYPDDAYLDGATAGKAVEVLTAIMPVSVSPMPRSAGFWMRWMTSACATTPSSSSGVTMDGMSASTPSGASTVVSRMHSMPRCWYRHRQCKDSKQGSGPAH